MKIKLEDLTGGDINLYFRNTYCRLLESGEKPQWVYVHGTGGAGIAYGNHPIEGVKTIPSKGSYIDCVYPAGYFNAEKTVLYGERISARQNLKGLNFTHNYNLTPLMNIAKQWGITKCEKEPLSKGLAYYQGASTSHKINGTFLTKLFEKATYPKVKDALKQLQEQEVYSLALSSEFALMPSSQSDAQLIFYHTLPVGELAKSMGVPFVKTLVPAYKQELRDFFEKQGLGVY